VKIAITNRYGSVIEKIIDSQEDCNTITSILYTCLRHEMFVLLRYVSDYDRTVFNSAQMGRVLLEWELLKALLDPRELPTWEKVREAIVRHRGKIDTYLDFIGLD
jgi:hypothetical protein